MKSKIGILGGTFNPIHKGHVELGLKIGAAFHLEKVLYILSARPPHKKGMDIAPAEIRWKMLQTALASFPQLEPCDIEMKRSSDSWTIDTIEEIKSQSPDHHFYFISGSEGFLKIRTWKLYKKLLNALSFIVILRKKEDHRAVRQLLQEESIPYCDTLPVREDPAKESDVFIYTYPSEHLRISSTFIRQQIKSSGYRGIEDFVGGEVKKIMEEYKLYEK